MTVTSIQKLDWNNDTSVCLISKGDGSQLEVPPRLRRAEQPNGDASGASAAPAPRQLLIPMETMETER